MKILVPFKAVPDPDAVIPGRGEFADVKWMINPFDSIALEEALQIRDRGDATEVVAVTIGPPRIEEQVRVALAMGVERATRVDESRTIDPYFIAHLLRAVVARDTPGFVIMGKQAVDDDCNQVGQMLAGLLDWPQATFVSAIEIIDAGRRARCTRETDSGLQVVEISLPAVITTDLRLNEPRYVSLPGLIRARGKPIETIASDELLTDVQPRTRVIRNDRAPSRPQGTQVESATELLTKLREEAQAI